MAAAKQSYTTNLGLPDRPTTNSPELFGELLPIYHALTALALSLDQLTGAMTTTVAQATGSTQYCIADAVITAGKFISITSTGLKVADASQNLPAHGLAVIDGNIGETVEYKMFGVATFPSPMLVKGGRYFLGVTGGLIYSSPYPGSGSITQYIGFALSETELYFVPDLNYTIKP